MLPQLQHRVGVDQLIIERAVEDRPQRGVDDPERRSREPGLGVPLGEQERLRMATSDIPDSQVAESATAPYGER